MGGGTGHLFLLAHRGQECWKGVFVEALWNGFSWVQIVLEINVFYTDSGHNNLELECNLM